MELTYLDYLFLDLFSTEESRKVNSVFHIISGKRTVSVLMQAMRMDLEPYFALFPKLQLSFFEERIKLLINLELLDSSYQLTAKGEQKKTTYFITHTKPDKKERMKYQAILSLFQARSLFLTQILSERAHSNKRYYPIQPRLLEQRWLKNFLKEQDLTAINRAREFGEEWLRILAEPELKNPDIFVEQIEGYHKSKLTTIQISAKYESDVTEIYVKLQEDWIQILVVIQDKTETYPILSAILDELIKGAGLCSESARETYRVWAAGLSIEQIVERRRLKESTINDHLTEMAILYETFPYGDFLNEAQLAYIDSKIDLGEVIDYNAIQQQFPGISFFHSRLMQVRGEVLHGRK